MITKDMVYMLLEEKTEYMVYVNGEVVTIVNDMMLEERGREKFLEVIKKLHALKYRIFQSITKKYPYVREYGELLTEIEFALQDAWGFEQNENYHRFWETPGCACPKMDNDDRFPVGYYIISHDCMLHGNKVPGCIKFRKIDKL